jgi:hypothetical protein
LRVSIHLQTCLAQIMSCPRSCRNTESSETTSHSLSIVCSWHHPWSNLPYCLPCAHAGEAERT